jgi:enoyl-[acyl-carrier-protein] reductase (NADH)
MVEVLFLLLGATLAFVYLQHEQKKDLEKRVKSLESDYLSLCDGLRDVERNVF